MAKTYQQRYYAAHREEKRRKSREWYAATLDARLAYRRRYYAEHRDEIRSKARVKRKQMNEKQNARHLKQKLRAIAVLGGKCYDCDRSFPEWPDVFDFDHRDSSQKRTELSNMLCGSWKKLSAELEKCDLVCANCHRIRTAKRRQ